MPHDDQMVPKLLKNLQSSNSQASTLAATIALQLLEDGDEKHVGDLWHGLNNIEQHLTSEQSYSWNVYKSKGVQDTIFNARMNRIQEKGARVKAIVEGSTSADPSIRAAAVEPAISELVGAKKEEEETLWSVLTRLQSLGELSESHKDRWGATAKLVASKFLENAKELNTPNERALASISAFGSPNPRMLEAAIDLALENLPSVHGEEIEANLWKEIAELDSRGQLTAKQTSLLEAIATHGKQVLIDAVERSNHSQPAVVSLLAEAIKSPNYMKHRWAIDSSFSWLEKDDLNDDSRQTLLEALLKAEEARLSLDQKLALYDLTKETRGGQAL